MWIILADAAQTGGHIAKLEAIYSRGGGLPSLIRQHEAEFAYVIAGRVRVPTKRLSIAFEDQPVDSSTAAIFGIALAADG